MTRQQARANLVAIGIAEPTEEQITNYLDQVGGETKRERDRADRYKADADRTADLQKQLDDLNSANLSEVEKANKDREDALKQIAALNKQLTTMQTMQSLAERGIVGDDAKTLINEDGTLNFETLGKIISDRETAAAAAKEKELLKGTPNPHGGSGAAPEKSLAETLVDKVMPKSVTNNDIVNQYLHH